MDLTKKHPKIPVIFGHMGGYHWMEVVEFAKTVSNAYLDLSAAFSTLAVRIAVRELPLWLRCPIRRAAAWQADDRIRKSVRRADRSDPGRKYSPADRITFGLPMAACNGIL